MDILTYLLLAIGGAIVGAIVTFIITRRMFIKQIKNNPPVNEKMIRAMYLSMGIKPSEQKIKQTMNAMNKANNQN